MRYQIGGKQVKFEISENDLKDCEERGVSKHEACLLVLEMGDDLLELDDEDFLIGDKDLGISLGCTVFQAEDAVNVKVIAVIHNENIIDLGRKRKLRKPHL